MSDWLLYPMVAFVLSALSTAVCMPFLLRLCKRRGMYDVPDERKVHHNNVPRLGGVLFIPALLIGLVGSMLPMMYVRNIIPSFSPSTFVIMTGMFLLYLIGLFDDLFGMRASVKFFVQLVVCIFLPFCGLYIHNLYGLGGIYEISSWSGYCLTIFVTLLIVNAVNLIDGIDGLSSGLCMMALLVFALFFYNHGFGSYVLYCTGLCGTVFAFFMFNMFGRVDRGTKTFMGDTGSLTLGYAMAYLAIRYMMTSSNLEDFSFHPTALLVPYTALLVPCFDLIRVALGRISRKESIFHPDKTHIHHKCLAAGLSMKQSLIFILGIQIFFYAFNYVLFRIDTNINIIIVSDVVIFTLLQVLLSAKAVAKEL